MISKAKTRNYYFDNAKFVLITMVILGHCLARLGEGTICKTIDASVYFFHMPLFIFISGFFSRGIKNDDFWKSILLLCESLIVFDLLHILLRFFLFDYNLSWSLLIIPQWSLWYLLSLIFWRMTIAFWGKHVKLQHVILAVLVGILVGFVPINGPLSFQRTFSLLPFFMFGYYCKQQKVDITLIMKLPIALSICVLVAVSIGVLYLDFPFKLFLEGVNSYYEFSYSLWLSAVIRLFLYLCCFCVSVCFMRLIPTQKIAWMSSQGSKTLHYYLYHTLIIYILIFIRQSFPIPTSFVAVLGYVLLIVLFIWLLIKIPFFRDLPNIVSRYSKVKHNVQ